MSLDGCTQGSREYSGNGKNACEENGNCSWGVSILRLCVDHKHQKGQLTKVTQISLY